MLAALTGIFLFGRGQREWDGKVRFTVIELGPPVVIMSFDPQTQKGLKLKLPDDLEVQSVGGRGKWRAAVLAKAGENKWGADSVAETLGITYVAVKDKMVMWDRWMWELVARKGEWQEINLEETALVEKEASTDGIMIWHLLPAWKLKVGGWFSSAAIASEQLKVRVINTTAVPGLGAEAATAIDNMGMKVVEVSSREPVRQKCLVRGPRNLLGVRSMVKWFGCDYQVGEGAELEIGEEYRRWKDG